MVKFIQEVDLLLNDGSKHINVVGWRKNATLPQRVETSRRRSRRCFLMSLALAKTSAQQVSPSSIIYLYAASFFLLLLLLLLLGGGGILGIVDISFSYVDWL